MKQEKTIFLLVMLTGVLLLGIVYAAVQNVTLTVSGTATASPDQGNFNVRFTGTPSTSGKGTITPKITGDTKATLTVTGLTAVGDTAKATFRIANESEDIYAEIYQKTTHTNSQYFQVTTELEAWGQKVAPGDYAELTITVKLIAVPITSNVTDNITVTVTASPTYYS